MHQTRKPVPMRDGIHLSSEVSLPSTDKGVWPVILVRTPYGPDGLGIAIDQLLADGYAVVCQDVRGTFASEGELKLVHSEVDDGEDTVRWLCEQAWCNGKVGLMGFSYPAVTQWLTALRNPPGLVTACPISAGSVFEGCGYIAPGIINLPLLTWHATMGVSHAQRSHQVLNHPYLIALQTVKHQINLLQTRKLSSDDPEHKKAMSAIAEQSAEAERQYQLLINASLFEAVEVISEVAPWLNNWVNNPTPESPYWQSVDWGTKQSNINIPMLHVAGWFDLYSHAVFEDFSQFSSNQPFQKLIVAPVDHAGFLAPDIGQRAIGEQVFPYEAPTELWSSGGKGFNKENLFRDWFNAWMKHEEKNTHEEAPITLFVMGDNVWRDEWEWPLARTQWTKFYLSSEGKANTANGNGKLSTALNKEFSTTAHHDTYLYDPDNPVPTKGGTIITAAGSFDQQVIEQRDDILVYTGEKLSQKMEVTGPIKVTLQASTSAVDTDFTAKLVDVREDGRAFNICDGVTRLRFRKNKPGLVTPGEVQAVDIELNPTSYVFAKGHRVRLEISSSNFPLFDPNPNTGKSLLTDPAQEKLTAMQSVFYGPDAASYLLLPVILASVKERHTFI